MMTDKIVPSIEQRMSAWLKIQDQLGRKVAVVPKPAVTISRQYGCEGIALAEELKELLALETGDPWTVFDKALIERVSHDTGMSKQLLDSLGDVSRPLDEVIGTLVPYWKTHAEAYRLLAKQLVALANQGNVIIVGRGGAVLTQSLSNCFHFRLVAPVEYRIELIKERLNITLEKARTLLIENQTARDNFIESLLNCSISDPCYYHCVFDISKSNASRIARSILCLMFES